MADENIYKGEKRKKVVISLEVFIPKDLTDEEQNEFLTELVRSLSKQHIFYKQGLKVKSISGKNSVLPGWEYA